MKKAFRAAVVAAAILFALTFIGSAKLKDESAHLRADNLESHRHRRHRTAHEREGAVL